MGTKVRDAGKVEPRRGGVAGALFSKVQRRVLGILFGDAHRSFYVNEIIAELELGATNADDRLCGAGARVGWKVYPKWGTMLRGRKPMAKTAQIRARVEPELKNKAEKILSTLGVSPTEAIRLFYKQVVLMEGIPFSVRVPNEMTRAAMDRTDRGEDLHSFDSAEEMFEELGI